MKKYHQTELACPLIDDPQLYLFIGAFGEVPQVEAILYGTNVCPDDTDPEVKNSQGTNNAHQLFQVSNLWPWQVWTNIENPVK